MFFRSNDLPGSSPDSFSWLIARVASCPTVISGCCALGGCAQSPWTEVSSERDGHALGETTGLTWRSADHWLRPLLARTAEPLAAASPASTPAASLAHGHRDTLLALIHPGQNTAATTDLHELRRGSSNREAGGQGGCVLTRPDVAAGLGHPVHPCAMVLLVCSALLGPGQPLPPSPHPLLGLLAEEPPWQSIRGEEARRSVWVVPHCPSIREAIQPTA